MLGKISLVAVLLAVMVSLSFALQSTTTITDDEYHQYRNISKDFRIADDNLNSVYNKLMSVLPPDEKEKLKQEQKEWIKIRDNYAFEEGPKGSTAYIEALVKITNDRGAELNSRLQNLNPAHTSSENEISVEQVQPVTEVPQSSPYVNVNLKQKPSKSESVQNDELVNQNNEPVSQNKKILVVLLIITIYILMAGIISLKIVRPPLIKWYESTSFVIVAKNPIDLLLKQVGYRISFELFVFALSCIAGAFGLWLVALFKKSDKKNYP